MSRILILTLLLLSGFAFRGHASLVPCEIDTAAFAATLSDFSPRIGEPICPDALITLPNVVFEAGEGMPAPNIIWVIYEDIPTTSNPNDDTGNLGVFLQDTTGTIIFGDGLADLAQTSIFDSFEDFKDIYLVPVIIADSINASTVFDPNCTGIFSDFSYPSYRLLNPAANPDVCEGTAECPDEYLEADACIGAISIDLANLAALKDSTYSNFCATAEDDPVLPDGNGCFRFNDAYEHTLWFQFTGTGATYDIKTLNCQRPDKEALGYAQITVFAGSCNNLGYIACAEDASGEALIDELETEAGIDYYVMIDGWGDNKGDFCLDMVETVPVSECNVLPKDLNINGFEFCVGTFSIDIDEVDAPYSSLAYVTSTDGSFASVVEEGLVDLPPGDYNIFVVTYLMSDYTTVFGALLAGGMDELLNVISTDDLCAKLNDIVYTITILEEDNEACVEDVCEADYGTVTVPDVLEVCVGTIIPFSIEGDNTVGYTTSYVFTQGEELIIAGASISGDLDLPVGEYTVHAFNYSNDDTEIVSDLVTGGLSASGIVDAIANGGLCAALEVPGTPVTILASDDPACAEDVCEADYGTVSAPSETTVCQGNPLSYSISGAAENGFTTLVVVTTGEELAVVDAVVLGETINLMPGTYTFHAFNFADDDATAIFNLLGEDDVRATDVVSLIDDGSICGELDVMGVTFTILAEDDPTCFVCEADFTITMEPIGSFCEGEAVPVPLINSLKEGYTLTWVITTGEDLEIVTTLNGGDIMLDAGTYTLHAFDYLNEDEAAILEALEMDGITGGDVLALIEDGTICASLDAAGMTFTILASDDPACVEDVCEAEFTVDVLPLGRICEGEFAELPMFPTRDGYTFTWVITTGEELTILTTVNGSFSLEPGDYTVHGFHYLNEDEATILNALATAGITGGDVLALINDGTICAALDVEGESVTFLAADDPDCVELDPLAYNSEIVLNDDETYNVVIIITGGDGNYTVDGMPIDGNTFSSEPTDCGNPYSFVIADGAGNDADVAGPTPCEIEPPCETSAGSLSDEENTLIVCAGDQATFVANGSTLEDGDILTYILHDGDENMFGDALAVSADGTFSGDGLTPNIPYYVVAAAGPTDADGNILIGDPCTSLSMGKPVVFLQAVSITTNIACNEETGVYRITFAVTGGLPAYDNSATYTVSGIWNGTANFGDDITSDGQPGGTSFTINAVDANGCSGQIVNDGVTCKQPAPIELISFEGEVETVGNVLTWSTASEYDNDYFILERSTDGIDFETVATVDSKGTSDRLQSYEWIDKHIVSGVTYYRLQQVDFDGQFTYSDVIALERGEVELGFTSIAPIPVIDRVSVSFTAEEASIVNVTMYDLIGKLLMSQTVYAENGVNEILVDMTDFSTGIYFISLDDGEKRMVERVMKK